MWPEAPHELVARSKKKPGPLRDALPISRVQCYHPPIYIRIFLQGLRHYLALAAFFVFVSTLQAPY